MTDDATTATEAEETISAEDHQVLKERLQEMKGKVSEFRGTNIELNKKIEKLQGMIPDEETFGEFRSWQEKKAAGEREAAEKKGDFEKITQQLKDRHAKELDEVKGLAQSMESYVQDQLPKALAAEYLVREKGDWQLLKHEIRRRMKFSRVVNEDGSISFERVILNSKGEPMLADNGEEAGVEDLILDLKKDRSFGRAFEGGNGFGGGASNTSGKKSRGSNPFSKDGWNLTEQMKIARSNPALARELRAQA